LYVADQFDAGFWPTVLAPALEAHLAAGHRSLRSWIAASRAKPFASGKSVNINTLADLGLLKP
jgi:molybdopterin-guanine dinucleotide biosynthesis protein A